MIFIIKIIFFTMICLLVTEILSVQGDKKLKSITGNKKFYTKKIKELGLFFTRFFNYSRVEQRIIRAGRPFNFTPEIYFLLKLLLPIIIFLAQIGVSTWLLYRFLFILVAFLFPDFFLYLVTRDRVRSISAELPEVVDIFETASSAGIEIGNVFQLAAEFSEEKELKKELKFLSAGYAVTKDKERSLSRFRDNIGLYDTDILSLALLQGDITGKTGNMLDALSLVQNNNVIAKIQREAKSAEYKVLFACALMALSIAAIYLYPYFSSLESGLTRVFS